MKLPTLHSISLLAIAFLHFPSLSVAAPPSTIPPETSAYSTDPVNSYVQDQVSDDMAGLNSLLCILGAMAPNLLVNQGDYIALVDFDSCESKGSGGQTSNSGVSYKATQVNSSRSSSSTPMEVKSWIEFIQEGTTQNVNAYLYATASQAPSNSLPYGIFRMDYCLSTATTCDIEYGYVKATTSGLAYFKSEQKFAGTFQETALQLSSSSSTNSGSGIVVSNDNSSGALVTSATLFAYSPDYFYRDDGNLVNGVYGQCFNRSSKYAEESAWRYGLYHASTGERFNHQTGFTIEYTDSIETNKTYNGYMSYDGIQMPVTVPNGATIYKITYGTSAPTKTAYTLLKSGGKLTKYTTDTKPLSTLNKVPFWLITRTTFMLNDLVTGTSIANLLAGTYEMYWDNTNTYFVVTGMLNLATNNMETLATPGYIIKGDIAAANTSGIQAESQLLGGKFYITGAQVSSGITSNTLVTTQTQDIVYPKDYAAINSAGGLKCISDCPTIAQISLYNSNLATTPLTFISTAPPYLVTNPVNASYSLSPTTGNLLDSAPISGVPSGNPVIQTLNNVVISGRLVRADDMAIISTLAQQGCTFPCHSHQEIDLLYNAITRPTYSYYVWETSANPSDQLALLYQGTDTTNTETFYPPLPVSFVIPNMPAKYGALAGSSISLQYGDFGNLWGITYKCIDIRTNTNCVFSGGTTTGSANYRWTPEFSIPTNLTEGYVTAEISQGIPGSAGYIAKGDQFWVKALDKEVRLAQVNKNICTALGLNDPVKITKLATSADWINPENIIKTKPVLNPVPAPRVIHGVKQY